MHFCNTFDDNNCSVSSGFVEKGYRYNGGFILGYLPRHPANEYWGIPESGRWWSCWGWLVGAHRRCSCSRLSRHQAAAVVFCYRRRQVRAGSSLFGTKSSATSLPAQAHPQQNQNSSNDVQYCTKKNKNICSCEWRHKSEMCCFLNLLFSWLSTSGILTIATSHNDTHISHIDKLAFVLFSCRSNYVLSNYSPFTN